MLVIQYVITRCEFKCRDVYNDDTEGFAARLLLVKPCLIRVFIRDTMIQSYSARRTLRLICRILGFRALWRRWVSSASAPKARQWSLKPK